MFNDEYFYLAFVVLENRKTMILISVYVKIQSFGVCLQINCLVIHKGPSIFNFGLIFFLLALNHRFWTRTGDFAQDESQDSPYKLFVTKSLYIMKKHKEHKNIDMHSAIPVLGNFNYPAILFSLDNVLDDFSLSTS